MIDDRVTDGKRIAQLLASELDGRGDDALERVAVVDADPGVEPTVDGATAYRVAADGDPIATVSVHPERARIDFSAGHGAVLRAAREAGLRARPAPGPRTLVFVESGAEVKRAVPVVTAAV